MSFVVCDRADLERLLDTARRAQRHAGLIGDAAVAALDLVADTDELAAGLARVLGVEAQPRLEIAESSPAAVVSAAESEVTEPFTVITPRMWARLDAALGSDDEPTLVFRR